MLIPAYKAFAQSLAIIEWLDETHPHPALLPKDAVERARVRAFSMAIACEIHPVQNLKVLARLRALGFQEDKVVAWAAETNRDGLAACEALISDVSGPFCFPIAILDKQLIELRRRIHANGNPDRARWMSQLRLDLAGVPERNEANVITALSTTRYSRARWLSMTSGRRFW